MVLYCGDYTQKYEQCKLDGTKQNESKEEEKSEMNRMTAAREHYTFANVARYIIE